MSEEIKPNPIKAELEARKKAAAELLQKRILLMTNVGKTFTDGEREGKVVEFVPDKNLRGKVADSFLVNFGNKHRDDFIHCEEFLEKFSVKA